MKIDILRENISEQSRFLKNNIELFFDKLDKIGEGGNATVSAWEGKNSANVCLKKIKELPVLKGNDLEREFDVQSQLFDADIKVPEPFLIFNDEKGNLYYFMERIRGASILEIGQGTKELPANFEIESFFQELENEVKKMHKAGFIHRDLRAGNVMILENGKPCLIDFGTAAKIGNVEDIGMSAYEESVWIYDPIKKDYVPKTGYFLEDIKESLPLLRETLKPKYWQMKGYFPTDQFGQRRS